MKRIIIILLWFGCAIFSVASLAKSDKAQSMPPAIVSAIKAQQQPWQEQAHATGTLTAAQGISIKAEVPGRVTHIYFTSGQHAQQGAPLVELDQSILRAQLQLYQANLRLSQSQFKRYADLYKKHFVSATDYDNAVTNLQVNQAQIAQVEAQLAQMLIKAPFNGKLGLRQVDLGDYVTAGQVLVNLQATNPMRVDFSVPESYLGKIAVGNTVLIHTTAYPDQIFKGAVYALEASINTNTRTLAMRAALPNNDNKLTPGAFVEVTLLLGKSRQFITLPQTALVSSAEGDYVYRAVNGHAVKTPIVVLQRANQQVTIRSGLAVGDMVITDGQLKIPFDGAPVLVMPPPTGTPANKPTH